jgi:Fe-S-cluster containining protein
MVEALRLRNSRPHGVLHQVTRQSMLLGQLTNKLKNYVECIQCGYCCGYRRDSFFGGCEYPDGKKIPVDTEDVCIYLEKLDNGFARCSIQEDKPEMCKLYYCLPEQKVRQLKPIIEHLKERCE